MTTLRRLVVACVLAAAACVTGALSARAQCVQTPRVATDVETVVSGGYWTAGGLDGRYRVIVVATGWEEVRYLVVIQWLRGDADRREVLVQASVGPSTLGLNVYSLFDPRLVRRNGQWYVALKATSEPLAPPREVSFRLGAPGRVTLTSPGAGR